MNYTSLLVPVFVEVALTFVLLLATGWMRVRSLSARQVKIRDIALGQNAWPARAQQISRAYQNQLELPLLFYVLIAFVLITRVESGVVPGHGYETARCASYAANLNSVAASDARAFCSALI